MSLIPPHIQEWIEQADAWEDYTKANLQTWIAQMRSLTTHTFSHLFYNHTYKKQVYKDISVRSLKIYYHHYSRIRSFTSSYHYTTSKLLLQGNWLRDKGFYIGNRVEVIALPGLLIITPETMIEKPSNSIITDFRLFPGKYRL